MLHCFQGTASVIALNYPILHYKTLLDKDNNYFGSHEEAKTIDHVLLQELC